MKPEHYVAGVVGRYGGINTCSLAYFCHGICIIVIVRNFQCSSEKFQLFHPRFKPFQVVEKERQEKPEVENEYHRNELHVLLKVHSASDNNAINYGANLLIVFDGAAVSVRINLRIFILIFISLQFHNLTR